MLERSLDATVRSLGGDGRAWERTLRPFANEEFIHSLLKPLWFPGGSFLRQARFGAAFTIFAIC